MWVMLASAVLSEIKEPAAIDGAMLVKNDQVDKSKFE